MSEDKNSTVPAVNSSQWKKNETTINNNPVLKKARDISQGLEKRSSSYTASDGGKGSARRWGNEQAYKDGWDRIWGNKND